MHSYLILNYILEEHINILKTRTLFTLLQGTPKERPLVLCPYLIHGIWACRLNWRYPGQGHTLRTHSQHTLKWLGPKERSQARRASSLLCSLPPAAPVSGPQPPGSPDQCSPLTVWTPQTRYWAAGSWQPGSSCWTPCSAGCVWVLIQMAVASFSLFKSGGVAREKHHHQCRGGAAGGGGRSPPSGGQSAQSRTAHPAAAAAIKTQLSLQRSGEGSIHASAGERGTLVTRAMATLGF